MRQRRPPSSAVTAGGLADNRHPGAKWKIPVALYAEVVSPMPDRDLRSGELLGEPAGVRRQRRAAFLRERREAAELRARVQPRRARTARLRRHHRMRTFRW